MIHTKDISSVTTEISEETHVIKESTTKTNTKDIRHSHHIFFLKKARIKQTRVSHARTTMTKKADETQKLRPIMCQFSFRVFHSRSVCRGIQIIHRMRPYNVFR